MHLMARLNYKLSLECLACLVREADEMENGMAGFMATKMKPNPKKDRRIFSLKCMLLLANHHGFLVRLRSCCFLPLWQSVKWRMDATMNVKVH